MLERHFKSLETLANHIDDHRQSYVDNREWTENWGNRWVVYADLVAFASRAKRSEAVVLNNIVRFDRASTLAAEQFPQVQIRRFSDASFAIADGFSAALGFAIAVAHMCLAFNLSYLRRRRKLHFIHLIVPRITMARGRVLLVEGNRPFGVAPGAIAPTNVLAGAGVVDAYRLERTSAGGLLTLDATGLTELQTLKLRGSKNRVRAGLERWQTSLGATLMKDEGRIFCLRRDVVDVPWLLLRPLQTEDGALWAADNVESDLALNVFLRVWHIARRGVYAPQESGLPLDALKHHEAGERFAVQCHQMSHGGTKPRYEDPVKLMSVLGDLPSRPDQHR